MAVDGRYAYIADGYTGLRIIDVSDPAATVEAGFYDLLVNANNVALAGNYIYVADMEGGLVILHFGEYHAYLPLGLHGSP